MNTSTIFARIGAALFFTVLSTIGVADAAVTVNKVFNPISVAVGAASTVTVTLQNSDTTTAVTITTASDDISTMGGKAVLDTTAGSASTTCAGGVVSLAGSVVTLTGGTIPIAPSSAVPGTCTFTFTVYGNQAGNGANSIVGTDVVTSGGNASTISQTLQVTAVSATVTAPANVTVPVNSPQTVTYTINNPATNVALTNSTPGAPLFTINVNSAQAYSVTSATSTCGSTTISILPTNQTGTFPIAFTGGSIPAGGSCTVTLVENSTVTGAVVNTSFPASGLSDDQGVTNTSAASSQVTFSDGRPNLAKAFNPSYIQPTGQNPPADRSHLTITIQNVYTNTQLLNAALTDALPAGVVIAATPNASTTCGGTLTAVAGATSVSLTGGTVPFNAAGNATCQIVVDVTAAVAGSYTNTIPAANFTATGITSAFNSPQATLTTTANGGSVSASKQFNVGSAGVNQPVQVTLRFNSLASGAFDTGTFNDVFPTTAPAMIAYTDPTHQPASSGCGAPTITVAGDNSSVSGSGLTIASGGTCTVTFWAVFPNTTPATRTATNTATGSFHPTTGGGANVNTSASANINELPTLTVVNYVASNEGLINQTQTVQGQISDPSGTTDTNAIGIFRVNAGSVVLASSNPADYTLTNCPNGTTVTPDPSLAFFTVNAGTISQTCTITYNVIDVGGATGTYTPAAGSYSGTLTGNLPVAATGTNNVTFSTSNINITKQFLPANNIHAGGVATAQIGLTVQGVFGGTKVTQANGVTFTDTLPTNMLFAPSPNVTFTGCSQAGQPAPTSSIVGSSITLSNLTLYTVGPATQTTCNVDFNVTSDVLGSPTNAIAAHAVTSTSGVTNSQSVSASLTVLSGIEVQKTFTAPTLAIGSTEYVRFLITNTQTASSPNDGALTDNMPNTLALASLTLGPQRVGDPPLCGGAITTGAVGSSSFTLTGLQVPGYAAPVPGQCVAYVLIGASPTAAANTAVANTIPAGGLSYPSLGVTNVNPSTGNGTLTPAPNVTLTKAFLPTTIPSGGTSVLTISIANTSANAAPLSALTVADTLPAGVTIAATPAASTTCGAGVVTAVAGGTVISLAGGSVAANATCTVSVSVTATVSGIYTNTIPASTVTSTQGATNGAPATAVLNIGNISGVTLAKSFSPALIAVNGVSTLTVTISNTQGDAIALSSIALNDSLPANVTIAPTPNAATTCTGGTVSAVAGGTTVGLAGASMAAGTTCTFSVSVTSATAGIYINQIPSGAFSDAQGSSNAAPAQATLNVGNASGVGLAKSFTPQAIAANGTSVLTISIANNAPTAVALSALGLVDSLPTNVHVAPVPNAATSCTGGAVAAAAGATSVTLSGATLAANASCTITVSVTSAIAGVYTNVIPANALTDAQNSTNDLPVQAILNVANASAVTLTKAFAPSVIPPGATSVLTISLANTAANAVPLTALAFVDNLPTNVTIAPTPNASTTCVGGNVTANAGGTLVTLSGAGMAVGNSCTVTVTVTGTIPNTYTNTIPAGSVSTAQGATNGSPAQANLIIGQPALITTKTSTPSGTGVSPGETIAYQIVIRNNGLQAETNAHLTDVITTAALVPGSVTVNGQPEPDQVVTAGQSFGSIAVGATVTIAYSATVNVGAPTGASVTNTATVAGDQPCTIGQCTSASPPNTVAPPILSATKTIDGQASESVLVGQTVVYGITISNTGTTPAINAIITDVVPNGIVVVPGSVTLNGTSLPTATLAGQTLTIPIGTVAAGASSVVTFSAKIGSTSGSASNTASVLAAGVTKAAVSNAALSHQVPAVITVTKTASATTATVGDRVDYQIVVAPTNGVAYGATLIVDTLPPGEVFAPGTARVNGKPVQPTQSGNTLIWTLPSLTAPATITYSTAIAPGVQQNTSLTNTVEVTAVAPGGAGVGRGSGSASVLIVASTFGSCYPITGRVYLDRNGSGHFQDPDVGLGAVHIYLDNGESVTTDGYGRYDFPCVHPGMHALRLDETTLPPGTYPYDDRNIDSEKSTRRLVHHIYDTTIIEDINFAVTGTLRPAK